MLQDLMNNNVIGSLTTIFKFDGKISSHYIYVKRDNVSRKRLWFLFVLFHSGINGLVLIRIAQFISIDRNRGCLM